jgi:hypothetical protein
MLPAWRHSFKLSKRSQQLHRPPAPSTNKNWMQKEWSARDWKGAKATSKSSTSKLKSEGSCCRHSSRKWRPT